MRQNLFKNRDLKINNQNGECFSKQQKYDENIYFLFLYIPLKEAMQYTYVLEEQYIQIKQSPESKNQN